MAGNLAATMLFRERRLGIALMLNASTAEMFPYVDITPLVVGLLGIADPTLEDFAWIPAYTPNPAELASVVGSYVDPVGFNADGERAIEVSVNPDEPTALVGMLTAWDGSAQSVDLTGFICSDCFQVNPSAHNDQIARFWRDEDGFAYAVSFGSDGGPPFYRVPSP